MSPTDLITDPFRFIGLLWPDVRIYDKQAEIIASVRDNDETFVPAGNQLGKDFISALVILWFFCSRDPCRVVTTSAKDDHLRVLWGEMGRFIQTARYPLDSSKGGPLIVKHQDLRKIVNPKTGEICDISYVLGMVASPDRIAAMQGHHATPRTIEQANDRLPRTLFVSDESSSVPDGYFTMAKTWAKRSLVIGNTWPCENFFKHAIKGKPGTDDLGGDMPRPTGQGYYRKVIRIKAEESPNVRLALEEQRRGLPPSGRVIVPGVKTFEEYTKNRSMWDRIQQCVSLDAEFYEGADVMLFPPEWLNAAERRALELVGMHRKAKAIGCDPAEGGDRSCWSVVDEYGLMKLVSVKTPDTSVIPNVTKALMLEFGVEPENVAFDRGGGGKQHADALRKEGFKVRTVAFGEAVSPPPSFHTPVYSQRLSDYETRYVYRNRRAQMYAIIRMLIEIDSDGTPSRPPGFAIPKQCEELRRQLAPIPMTYDDEGRLELPPKNRRPGTDPNQKKKTLIDLIGHSPDEADSLALACYAMVCPSKRLVAGPAF